MLTSIFPKMRGTRAFVTVAGSVVACACVFGLDWKINDAVLAPLACIPLLTIALVNSRIALVSSLFVAIAFASLNSSHSNIWIDAFALTAAYAICVQLLTFATELARRKAMIETQIRSAQAVHDHLFPAHLPDAAAWSFEVVHAPLHDVGGDFYSVDVRESVCRVFIGDVTGKGLRASMLLSAIKVLIDAAPEGDPGRTLSASNRSLKNVCTDEMFCTGWYGELHDTGDISFAAAGHEPCLIARVGETRESLEGGGVPLGMFDNSEYSTMAMKLQRGDRVLLYSDGLSELFSATPALVQAMFDGLPIAERLIRASSRRDDVLALMIQYRGATPCA
jgi:hypothetical protein